MVKTSPNQIGLGSRRKLRLLTTAATLLATAFVLPADSAAIRHHAFQFSGGLRGPDHRPPQTDCAYAVALDSSITNEVCAQKCKTADINSSAFKAQCGFVDYWIDSTNVKSDDCFAMQIYGYVRAEGSRQRAGYEGFSKVKSPHDCQVKCQNDGSKCVNWIWSEIGRSGSEPNCFLKSQEYINKAWLGSGDFNIEWCNSEMSEICYEMKQYECVGQHTCIWCSHEWLSGPRHCHAPSGLTSKPQAGPDGFPICDGIPDDHITTVNPDPNKPTRPPGFTTLPATKPSTAKPPVTQPPITPVSTGSGVTHTITGKPGGSTTTTASNTTTTTEEESSVVVPVAAGAGAAAILALAGLAAYKWPRGPPSPEMVGNFDETDADAIDDDKDVAVFNDEDVFVQ